MFFVIAYRWGWTNCHQYVVDCSAIQEEMIDVAHRECQDRGGKYGVAVYRVDSVNASHKLEVYFPSLCDETSPYVNAMIEVQKDIGRSVLDAATCGSTHLPSPVPDSTFLVDTPVEVPTWLKDEVNRKTEHYQSVYKQA